MTDQPDDEREVQIVLEAVDSLEALGDPAERARRAGRLLAELPDQQARLRRIRQAAVADMRARNISYRQIAKQLGVSLTRVQQIEAGERGKKAKAEPDA
ncbi:helix-turn-helix domain-containing protein [Streptomyces sp. NPDC014991]|uniref:helix-turn-helix domain-containing protein n=1 Tax=Streptomyces sp. NPDC014991 TaxID=3364935 RepID=UPI0037025F92